MFSELSVSTDGLATGLNQREEERFGDVESDATLMMGPVRGEGDRDWRGWGGSARR